MDLGSCHHPKRPLPTFCRRVLAPLLDPLACQRTSSVVDLLVFEALEYAGEVTICVGVGFHLNFAHRLECCMDERSNVRWWYLFRRRRWRSPTYAQRHAVLCSFVVSNHCFTPSRHSLYVLQLKSVASCCCNRAVLHRAVASPCVLRAQTPHALQCCEGTEASEEPNSVLRCRR